MRAGVEARPGGWGACGSSQILTLAAAVPAVPLVVRLDGDPEHVRLVNGLAAPRVRHGQETDDRNSIGVAFVAQAASATFLVRHGCGHGIPPGASSHADRPGPGGTGPDLWGRC